MSLKFASIGLYRNVFNSIEEHSVYKSFPMETLNDDDDPVITVLLHVMQPTSSLGNWHFYSLSKGWNPAVWGMGSLSPGMHRSQLSAKVIKGSDPKGEVAENSHWYFLVSLGFECLNLDCFSPVSSKAECWGCFLLFYWWFGIFFPQGSHSGNVEYCWDGEGRRREGSAADFWTNTALFLPWFLQWQSHHSLKSPLSNWFLWPECTELPVQMPRQSRELEGVLVLFFWWPVPAMLLLFSCWSPADRSGSIWGEGSESNGLMVLLLTWWCLMCCRYARVVVPVSLSSLCSCADSFPSLLLSWLCSTRSFSGEIFAFASWILSVIHTLCKEGAYEYSNPLKKGRGSLALKEEKDPYKKSWSQSFRNAKNLNCCSEKSEFTLTADAKDVSPVCISGVMEHWCVTSVEMVSYKPFFSHGGEILTPSCQAEPMLSTKASFHVWPRWNAWSRIQHSSGLSSQAYECERCWRCEEGSMWVLAHQLRTTDDLLKRLKCRKMKRKRRIWL